VRQRECLAAASDEESGVLPRLITRAQLTARPVTPCATRRARSGPRVLDERRRVAGGAAALEGQGAPRARRAPTLPYPDSPRRLSGAWRAAPWPPVRRTAGDAPRSRQVAAECGEIAMAMVQNKCDLLGPGGVAAEAAEAVARRLRLRFYRTCVREGHNCDAGARPGARAHGRAASARPAQPVRPAWRATASPSSKPGVCNRPRFTTGTLAPNSATLGMPSL